MIKKIFKSLLLFGILLIPCFSNAYEIIDQGKVLVDIPSDFSLNSKDYSFNNYGNITTDGSSYFEWKNNNGSFYLDYLYGWIDGKLYFYSYESESNRTSQGFVNSFWKTNNLTSTRNFDYSATDFYNLNPDITKIVFGNDSTSITYSDKYWTFYLCFFNNNDSYYYCAGGAPILWYEQEKYSTFTGSLGFLSVDNAKDGNWGISPFIKEYVPIQDTTDITDGDIIDYYENNPVYNFNRDMCYIGTTDLSSNYEDRITYYQGSGYTIYEFFEQLYGNNFKLSDLDTWLNSWLVNFNTFFNGNNRYSDGTPWYVLRYNGIGNLLIDKNNLDNPFLNNKSAYYFMASTIYDSYKGYDLNPNSEDIAVYCYKKTLVSSDIEFNAPNGIRNNIGNWVNQKNKGKGVGFSGWSIVEGESWNGTPLDYFSGDNIVYTGFNSFFKSSFNRFAGVFQGLDPSDLVLGQIPSYILGFLLLLILFRFLSH